MFRDVGLCFMRLHAIASILMRSPIAFMRNWKNRVKVTGLSCIPIGTFYNDPVSFGNVSLGVTVCPRAPLTKGMS